MSDLDLIALRQKALGDPIRLRIIGLLSERSLCVCEIEAILELPQYAVSRQLSILRRAELVESGRKGTWMHYHLSPNLLPVWQEFLSVLCRITKNDQRSKRDRQLLRKRRKEC